MGKTYVVVGAGFRGFCDSLQLLKNPSNKVYIVDRDPFFGGISYSVNVKGFAVDKGVHMFDSVTQELADIVTEIMDGKVRTIDFISVSAFNNIMTDGFSLPDLSSLDESIKQRITDELMMLAKTGGGKSKPSNLLEYFYHHFGQTAGDIFANIFRHVYNIDPAQAQPDAISKTSLHRLKFGSDEDMMRLKQSNPWLDSVLAARRKAIGKVDDLVSVYPDTGEAMRGWCDRAAKWLEARGAVLCLGQQVTAVEQAPGKVVVVTDKQRIDADHVVWTNDNTKALAANMGFEFDASERMSGTPMLFATMMTKAEHIKNFTYLQNFDLGGITYRTASAGIYSNQIREDGASFITSECPVAIDSDAWKNAPEMHAKIWEECKRLEIVAPEAELLDHVIMRAPVTFKVAKLGYDEKIREFNDEVRKRNPRVIFRDVKPFFRREIFLDSKHMNVMDMAA
jgi:hypothetical protein